MEKGNKPQSAAERPPHPVAANRPSAAPPAIDIATTPDELHALLDQNHPWRKAGADRGVDPAIEASIDQALDLQKKSRGKLDEIFAGLGVANSDDVYLALARRFGVPFVRARDFPVAPEVIAMVTERISRTYRCVPLLLRKGRLVVATDDPTNAEAINMLRFVGNGIDVAVSTPHDIELALDRHYRPHAEARIFDALAALNVKEELDEQDVREAERLGSEKPVVQLVDNMIAEAIRRRASDVHVHPEDHHVELIYRIDGTLMRAHEIPKSLLAAVVSRIKILGRMNIAERRLPQDGRVQVSDSGRFIDLRISVIPTVRGESVVIRILNTNAGMKSINELGFNGRDGELLKHLLHKSYGMVLVTGPTGCGKTTTLYAALQEIKKRNVNIITIEDPVEYRMQGIEQIQVQAGIGFTFARALRNILRHDPNVVMVGEIRDRETGTIAVESALTGHLVLSTLHTNDAAGAITRLVDMGIEPYLVSSSVLGVLAQRLVRRNCPHCLMEEQVDPPVRRALEVSADEVFHKGRGCESCHFTGYSGRFAVYELLEVTDSIREELLHGVSAGAIRGVAVGEGMTLLTQQALEQARQRRTSLAEVYRVRLA
jgi:type IV pilus assembly protein PilB